MSMLLPMRSNRPFGEQKSCWMSIMRRAVWLGSTTSSMGENTSLPSAVIITVSPALVDLVGDFAMHHRADQRGGYCKWHRRSSLSRAKMINISCNALRKSYLRYISEIAFSCRDVDLLKAILSTQRIITKLYGEVGQNLSGDIRHLRQR